MNLHASLIASLPEAKRQHLLSNLTEAQAATLLYDWPFWARPCQQREDGTFTGQLAPPGNWRTWLILAGRGYGKTRTGAEWMRDRAASGRYRYLRFIGATAADVRDVMVEGQSGILAISSPDFRPEYFPSKRKLVWPNGAIANLFSADEPDRLRGPQCDTAWLDELAAWRYAAETYSMHRYGMRLGDDPREVITTTPRPIPIIKEMVKRETVVVTTGSSYENIANLAEAFVEDIINPKASTREGQQEVYAKILEDTPGALWTQALIEQYRVTGVPEVRRIVVAIDPAASSSEDSAETGIVVAALGVDGHGYVLDDVTIKASPNGWARAALSAYQRWDADLIVAETNNGGEMVETVIMGAVGEKEQKPGFKQVHASRGKATRAEPISSLYEQGKIHHVGDFGALETQMTTWVPGEGKSPDRVDAMVWALTELMLNEEKNSAPAKFTPKGLYPGRSRRGGRRDERW